MLIPRIGSRVWFHTLHIDPTRAAQVHAAIVCHVHSESEVNLAVFDAHGNAYNRTHISFIQDNEYKPDFEYAAWMPTQIEQPGRGAYKPAQDASGRYLGGSP